MYASFYWLCLSPEVGGSDNTLKPEVVYESWPQTRPYSGGKDLDTPLTAMDVFVYLVINNWLSLDTGQAVAIPSFVTADNFVGQHSVVSSTDSGIDQREAKGVRLGIFAIILSSRPYF
ncbi:hypothetical protein BO79DRAFT_217877 [Aspergillus costaricaensis CBS 115574]|uniref:Uncharacterized protein n=1 Tax=Aspergillus costaricaensis CBS 115574 TaxID=1448317 RepID=A0ACD1IEP3_9EURO|nr:hypothetical protein BO79DRAFT_217877 [Aspergillus costaricaensis CBS 115574]RAK88561.1 hypothetical protein BO79DRAFT_217877 [Aspergillus costaricaensis CBS 115574]